MSNSEHIEKPKTKAALAGGPPRPPKKTARELDDSAPDPLNLTAAEREKLRKWIEEHQRRAEQ